MSRGPTFIGILFALLSGACTSDTDQDGNRTGAAQIVYAITPNLFAPDTAAPGAGQTAQAFRALLAWEASDEDVDAEALVLSGDFGLTSSLPPQSVPTDSNRVVTPVDLQARAKVVADVLRGARHDVPIFVVPAGGALGPAQLPSQALAESQKAIEAVRSQLASAEGPPLTDLSGCYVAPVKNMSQCIGRLPGRHLRLVGFPAFQVSGAPPPQVVEEQRKWTAILQQLMNGEDAGWRTVLIAPLTSPVVRHWGSDSTRKTWMDVAKKAVIAIGVSPSQPMQRAQYELKELWNEEGLEGRWVATPPLFGSVKAVRPAEGVAAVSVSSEGAVNRRIYWYAPGASPFRSNVANSSPGPNKLPVGERLFQLGTMDDLTRWSVLLIALLAAFLTAVAVWQIPPAEGKVTLAVTTGAATDLSGGGTSGTTTTVNIPQSLMDKWAPASFLQQNFSRTVLSGLGGLAVATLTLESMGDRNKADAQSYYLVWFIISFFVLLLLSSILRAIAEGVRALVYVGSPTSKRSWGAWFTRPAWFMLTTVDVFMNLLQGRNELKSAFWAEEIRKLQEDALLAIDQVCEHLHSALMAKLKAETDDIRVAVSVLADDGKRAYYVSRPAKSAAREFGTDTVAFISIAASVPRWWISRYAKHEAKIIILKNDMNNLPLSKGDRTLSQHFSQRAQDYGSFIVFPIPLRSADPGKRAGLHISFKNEKDLETLWPKVNQNEGQWATLYDTAGELLDASVSINRLVKQSAAVIQSVLRNFNERVFETAQLSRRRV